MGITMRLLCAFIGIIFFKSSLAQTTDSILLISRGNFKYAVQVPLEWFADTVQTDSSDITFYYDSLTREHLNIRVFSYKKDPGNNSLEYNVAFFGKDDRISKMRKDGSNKNYTYFKLEHFENGMDFQVMMIDPGSQYQYLLSVELKKPIGVTNSMYTDTLFEIIASLTMLNK